MTDWQILEGPARDKVALEESEYLHEAVERFMSLAAYDGSPYPVSFLMQVQSLLQRLEELKEARHV